MTDKNFDCDVVVVGAGLSGLVCADLLCNAGLNTIVLEAADRIGGRIHSVKQQHTGQYAADLGPTWVWPQYQPVVTEWLERLGVETFHQFEDGDAVLDLDENSPVHRQPVPGQHGIRRLLGGPQLLIDTLFGRLPQSVVSTGHSVEAIETDGSAVVITTSGSGGPGKRQLRAERVVVAIPLRVAARMISWSACLDTAVLTEMKKTPTWMATQAKAVAFYDSPFWRKKGLSGRVASRVGPLMEVHDHSLPDGGQAALFGFVGWPYSQRRSKPGELREEIRRQLVRCFGGEAADCNALHIEDWASNRTICSDLDLTGPPAHPVVASDLLRTPQYAGRLYFAVAETAVQSPGLIEGAFAAANTTAASLIAAL